jgi:hypothetical protein
MRKHGTTGEVSIDFPHASERIESKEYTFRIGTKIEGSVDVSIDGGPWRPCRRSVGYWWFDWNSAMTKTKRQHRLLARVKTKEGEELQSQSRRFETALSKPVRERSGAR